ncbi:hypothetical protein NIES2119_26315 [[Phormidium ambiguum] IAM M-71]|uniref:Uncharacterized protein n=1 Tax=[Phormidium ambiguum] IAM M-71 TaxID=454136 RepID=A0A1U7I7F2_9CYAN|nr:hypothetical protein [Phormidium ambiguum]OKH32353.1 hypothetical protein NIES2119_26315 [Phormidium ambiguum IAM M-71]
MTNYSTYLETSSKNTNKFLSENRRLSNFDFWVARPIAPLLTHLIDEVPKQETRTCRYCSQPAIVLVDEHDYQCPTCGDRLVRFDINSE